MQSIQDRSLIGVGVALIIIIGLIAGVGGIVTSDDRPPIGEAPPINNTTAADGGMLTQSQSQSMSESLQTYAVTATSADAIKPEQLAEYGKVGTQAEERIELRMASSDVTTVENISWVTNVRSVMRPETTQTDFDTPGGSQSDNPLGVARAHENGITGKDVEVGIIGDGFDINNPAVESNIVNRKSFRETQGDPEAGTSKAEIVTRTAPESQLHLISAETDVDHERAIDYLNRQDVDIIIYGYVWYYPEDDGDNFLSDEINDATTDGSLVVTQPGDNAQTHWEGEFRDTDDDDFHEWTRDGDELNAVPGIESNFRGGEIQVTARWEDEGDFSNYKLYLYNPLTEEYIAEGESTDNNGDILQTETNNYATLFADVAQQPLSVVIENIQGPADDEIEVTVVQGAESIERNIPASSILTPGDVPAALTVAAYERNQNQVATYSGRGPTDDGRTGIDVTGYTNIDVRNEFEEDGEFGGTFASAAYVGGVAALVEDDQPGDQSPSELTQTLRSSSDDILNAGTDTASGSGVVNAQDAVGVEVTLQADFLTNNGQISADDAEITFAGSAAGTDEVVVAFVGPRGQAIAQTISVDDDNTFGREDFSLAFRSTADTLSEGVVSGHIISSGRDGTFGDNFTPSESEFADIIATGRTGPSGTDFSESANTGEQVRELIIANSVDDTASDDLVITETFQFVSGEEQQEDKATNVTRIVSSSEVAPGGEVTVTTEITGVSGSVSASSSYEQPFNSATVQSVTVNGGSANPIISEATVNGSTVTLSDVGTDATVTITEELTVSEELNVTHTITGDVTAGETTADFDPVSVTVTDIEPQSPVDEYDANNDGNINIIELGQAGQAFASGELTITELGEVGAAFAS